ncbi:hypothetical protein OG883_42745 [Streptomyces sp. NBC_01142]|uniref:hypothetical protein n=1 Tax=Streptomyces sp. NBC_01142 TaxID=2975865 RepID=UPI00224EFA17|nr:hypothetical protein [Streptomyces sp. NBC_01142]MCX4826363.1 hypothetical protein [Streptomyces sp. NBC_01142]
MTGPVGSRFSVEESPLGVRPLLAVLDHAQEAAAGGHDEERDSVALGLAASQFPNARQLPFRVNPGCVADAVKTISS